MLNTSHTNMHLLDALNDNGVEYMVVGGLAVRFYCPERTVRDLDLLVNPATDNARKAIEALTYLARAGLVSCDEVRLSQRWSGYEKCLRLRAILRADLFLAREGYDFSTVYAYSIEQRVNEIPVRIIPICDLIKYKETDDDPDLHEKNERDLKLLRQELRRRFQTSVG